MSKGEASLRDLRGDDPLNSILPLLNETPSKPERNHTNKWQSYFHIGSRSHSNTVFMPLIQPKPGFKNLFQFSIVVRRRPMLQSPPETKVHH